MKNLKKAKKILYIEDDPDQRDIFKIRMESRGYNIGTAENGKDGVVQIQKQKPQFIFSDLMLGDMTGLDVHNALRFRHDKTPFQIITSTPFTEHQMTALKRGLPAFLHKPANFDEVESTLETYSSRLTEAEYLYYAGQRLHELFGDIGDAIFPEFERLDGYYNSYLRSKPRDEAVKLLEEEIEMILINIQNDVALRKAG